MNDMALAFPPELLKRQAVIYVRQSTQSQVMTNLESQRRQYDLVEMARGYPLSKNPGWGVFIPKRMAPSPCRALI